jgi:hypothetical protein
MKKSNYKKLYAKDLTTWMQKTKYKKQDWEKIQTKDLYFADRFSFFSVN